MGDIREVLEQARKQLLDLGARNRLLNTPRHRSRGATVEIVDERSDQVFAQLVGAGQAMGFRARPDPDAQADATEPGDLFADLAPPDEDLDRFGVAARHRDAWLQTGLGALRLQSRLLKLHYDARRYHEERGVDVLYLAEGFLEWYEAPAAAQPRFAPLLLVPVRLDRGSALERFRLRYDGDEIATNLSLVEKLRREFRLDLPEIADAEALEPAGYFEQVRAAIADEPRFRVHPDDIVLGLFSFTKLLMYRDLDPASWPAGADPTTRPLVRALLGDGFGDQPEAVPDDGRLDERISIRDTTHVLDADASQAIAIEEVRRGRNLLIQGPPGTGKSQTIANLIAGAVKNGQSVLFVAEKMAALEVVKRRLEQIGLGDMCLELHSHNASKRAVLDDLKATLALGRPRVGGIDALSDRLERARDRLNRHADALHAPIGQAGFTAYHAIGRLLRLARRGLGRAEICLPGSLHWTRADLDERRGLIGALAQRVQAIGSPAAHLWRGVGLEAVLPGDVAAFGERAQQLAQQLRVLQQATRHLARQLDLDQANSLGDVARLLDSAAHLGAAPAELDPEAIGDPVWRTQGGAIRALIDAGLELRAARTELAGVVAGAAWSLDVAAARRDLAAHGRSWLRFLNRDYRRARATLRGILIEHPPGPLPMQLTLLDALIAGQAAARTVAGEGALGAQAFGRDWHDDRSDWSRLAAIGRWLDAIEERDLQPGLPAATVRMADPAPTLELAAQTGRLRDAVVAACEELFEDLQLDLAEAFGSGRLEATALDSLGTRLEAWSAQPTEITVWIAYRNQTRRAVELGLAALTSRLHDGRLRPERARACFEVAYFEPLMRAAYQTHPELATFDGADHDGIVGAFCDLDRERIALARAEVARAHHQGLPQGPGAAGQLKVLHREFNKKRRHLPIRKLLVEAGRPVQAIKPVFMMSPLSVAEFLAPGGLRFDLLVIDEASQVEPVDALGAVARAGRLVVVGDDRQLPPTPFFRGRATDDDDHDDDDDDSATADLESILGLCAAHGMPRTMLRWHYRSRHPSLIAVSNREFYDSRLHIVPSPRAGDPQLGLAFRHVPEGRFDRGGAAINQVEARAVAEAVIAHAQARPELSLGVGCFSVRQRDAILHELEHLWRDQPEVRDFFEADRAEPFFVKNLENVQGDERDVVFISVGYARDPSGYLAMRFGPLNAEGGERRLNVLITRARRQLVVFSGITADDLDLERARGLGVAALKTFLHYARTGVLGVAETTERGFDSPFEEEVASALVACGHQIDSQIGVAGFYVDLAVRDPARPGRHLLGIECDGAAYHSAASARDRDRLRQQLLEDQGWIIHRIWSSDWYRRPDEQLRRVVAAIDQAKVRWGAHDDSEIDVAASDAAVDDVAGIPRDEAPLDPPPQGEVPASRSSATLYVEVDLALPGNPEPHLLAPGEMVDAVMRIVEIEGPIHRDEIARRVSRACGCERTGRRIVAAVRRGLARAAHQGLVTADHGFYQRPGAAPAVRDRSAVRATTLRRPDMLPPAEIRAAALQVAQTALGAAAADVVTQVSRLLGFQATSSPLRRVIEREIDRLLAQRLLARASSGQLEVPQPEVSRSSSKPAA